MEDREQFIAQAKADIKKYMKQKGKYTHNLVGIVLRKVAETCGYEEANLLTN